MWICPGHVGHIHPSLNVAISWKNLQRKNLMSINNGIVALTACVLSSLYSTNNFYLNRYIGVHGSLNSTSNQCVFCTCCIYFNANQLRNYC